MNLQKRIAFEAWCKPLGYDISKVPAMRTENPYVDSGTWKAYEAWCARHQESINLEIETAMLQVLERLEKILSENFSPPLKSHKLGSGIFRVTELRDELRELVKKKS